MSKHNKALTIINIIVLFLLIIGMSYAAFTTRFTGLEVGETMITGSGVVEINYSSGPTIEAPNIYPASEPFIVKEFTLTGKNSYNAKMEYHIVLVMNTNTFRSGALTYTLEAVNENNNGDAAEEVLEHTSINTGERDIILGNGNFNGSGNHKHKYTLKLYFLEIEDFDHRVDQGKQFSSRIEIREGNKIPGFNEDKKVNHPILASGMTPVIWNGEEFTEINENDIAWYDYDNKRWANARTDDGSYWVWIPRYAYKITSGYHQSSTGTIDVKFLQGKTNQAYDETTIETTGYNPGVKDTSMHHFLHPAFHDELGFWVAKYEASSHDELASGIIDGTCSGSDNVPDKAPKIEPNAVSWRCINNSNAYYASLAMKDNPIYGWNSSEVDTHMMTNLEWGAVTYLSKSKYGAHTNEVWNNAYTGFVTGCSGTGASAASEGTCVPYHTENGQKASTTHNSYGVYDMAGGAWDRVMGNYNGHVGISGFGSSELSLINSKHITRYYTDPEDLHNGYGMDYDLTVYGDAIHETSNNAHRYSPTGSIGTTSGAWNSDYSHLPYVSSYPWFRRGGLWSDGSSGGAFAFGQTAGNADWRFSFRPAVVLSSVP